MMASTPGSLTPAESLLRSQNHDAQVIAVVAVFSTLAIFATVVRLASRHIKKSALGADDILLLIALLITLAESSFIAYGLRHYGLGRHLLTLSKEQLVGFNKLWYSVGLLQPTALATTKVSVLVLFHHIFIQATFRLATKILGAIVLLWWIGTSLADALICIPIQHNWDPGILAHCGNKQLLAIITPIPWIVTDLAILLMPLPMVWHLQLPRLQRVGLAGLFLLGGLALVTSCVRYSTLFYQHDDVTYYIISATVWTVIESNVTIISACLIMSRPCLVKLYPERLVKRLGWEKSRGRKYLFSSFARLTEFPPVVSKVSMGEPFDSDIEQNILEEMSQSRQR